LNTGAGLMPTAIPVRTDAFEVGDRLEDESAAEDEG